MTNALTVRHHSSSPSVIVVTTKELRSTLLFTSWHHLLCSPNALDRASPLLSTLAIIVILAGAQAAAMEERASLCRGCQVGEGILLSLFLPEERKPKHKSFVQTQA
ncbi:hypothetical protein LR48_Vigan11g065200 [Vigna angularis]|uniref:Uncharacterized protein n=1 Tax=Phaseolus angularis TaxID=3914 RepID=A0A0L9VS94_PHAAN|nr:hypothetical protein LR48_Vigan11g065200 [Vigna angularis]